METRKLNIIAENGIIKRVEGLHDNETFHAFITCTGLSTKVQEYTRNQVYEVNKSKYDVAILYTDMQDIVEVFAKFPIKYETQWLDIPVELPSKEEMEQRISENINDRHSMARFAENFEVPSKEDDY